jgi:hypothetical protein
MDRNRATGSFAVKSRRDFLKRNMRRIVSGLFLSLLLVVRVNGQAVPYARTFAKPKADVEQALKDLQAYPGQKLPIVDGFVGTPQQPLDKYERAFYQFSIEVLPGVPSGTIVQVSAKITAWYADKDPAKSGYQILPSNGRLELDLLDRLDEKFGNKSAPGTARALASSGISAPAPKLNLGGGFNISSGAGNPIPPPEGTEELNKLRTAREAEEKRMRSLNEELQGLEDVKKNQAHPLNLVAVKRAGTPVMARAGEESRVLFKAAVNDEFEFLDAEGEWIHVQISGVSRGYIRRGALELPEVIAARLEETAKSEAAAKQPAFRVEREENSVFPGEWEALKGKTVKIYTVQPASQDAKETGARAKLKFAGSLMQKFAEDVTPGAPGADGVVVIFDSADGGIAGATLASIQQLAKGEGSEEAFWKQCYLDPPETFQSKH